MFRVVESKNGSCILDKSTGRILCVIPKRSEASITSSPPPTSNCRKIKQPASHIVPETRSTNNSSSNVNRTNDHNCDRNNNACRVNQSSSSQSSISLSCSPSVSSNPNSGNSILTKCGLLLNGLNGSSNSTLEPLLLSPNNLAKPDSGIQSSKIPINQSERSHRSQQKQKVETLLKVDLCSALGRKMLATAPEAKFKFDMTNFYFKTEKNCSTENKSVLNGMLSDVNRPRPGKSRMTRSNNVINGVVAPSWGPRHYVHTYTFNKTQRLERWRTLETGLNWRGRIKAFCCRSFKVTTPRLISCPLCKTHIGRTKNHNCSDHRNSRRISSSVNKRIEDQTNLDPSVIFADLKDNTEFILSLTEKRRSRYPTRLNGSRLNANQTKVTSNGNCKSNVAIINTKSTDDKKKISNSLNNSYHNVYNNVENTDHKNHHISSIYESLSDCPSTSNSPICDPSSPTNTLKADNKHVFHFDEPKCYSFYFTNYL